MKQKIEIYDNGGKTYDRFTIILLNTGKPDIFGSRWKTYEAIGASETGAGFYQHTHAMRGKHLGKKVPFIYLHHNLQRCF